MKLTPEDHAKLETKQLANIIRKLNSGKTLTAREEAILARSRASGEDEVQTVGTEPLKSGFAKTWDDLAEACSVDRRTLTNAREKFGKLCPKDKADGRKDIARWIAFLEEKGIRGRGVNNPEVGPTERDLRLREWKLKLDRAEYELKRSKDELVPVAHVEAALGQMLAKFRQALDALPARIADGIDEADHDELFKLLTRAEKEKLTYRQLKNTIEKGQGRPFADFHGRRQFVESEVATVMRSLVACEYLEADPDAEEE